MRRGNVGLHCVRYAFVRSVQDYAFSCVCLRTSSITGLRFLSLLPTFSTQTCHCTLYHYDNSSSSSPSLHRHLTIHQEVQRQNDHNIAGSQAIPGIPATSGPAPWHLLPARASCSAWPDSWTALPRAMPTGPPSPQVGTSAGDGQGLQTASTMELMMVKELMVD